MKLNKEEWANAEERADEEERLDKYLEFDNIQELLADLHHAACAIYTCSQCGIVYYPESATDMHCI